MISNRLPITVLMTGHKDAKTHDPPSPPQGSPKTTLTYLDSIVRNLFHVADEGKRGIGATTDATDVTSSALSENDRSRLQAGTWHRVLMPVAILPSMYTLLATPYFLFWPAIAGILLGLCIVRMYNMPKLSPQSRMLLVPVGWKTAINIAGAGIVFTAAMLAVEYFTIFVLNQPEVAIGFYLVAAAFYLNFVMQIWRIHTSPSVLSRRRAFYDRFAHDGTPS
jgi:hypothetical protein